MSKLRPMLPYLSITAIGFYLIPLFANWLGMGLMLFVLPAFIFICAAIYGIKNSFHWTFFIYPIIVSALFIPTIFIYYNYTAVVYIAIFGVIALVASFIGRQFSMKTP